MSLKNEIESVVALFPQEMIANAKKHRFTIVHGAMGFTSRSYAGGRDWLITDNEDGRSMVLTGNLYLQFEKEINATKTQEDVNEIILKFFDICEAEDDVLRRLQGKPTHREERARKKELLERKQVIENRINELDAVLEKLWQRKEDELLDATADWKKTYVQMAKIEKELETLETEHFQIERELRFGFGFGEREFLI